MDNETREKIIQEILNLDRDYSYDEAVDMIKCFIECGGLYCRHRWPFEFSFFASKINVFDILLKYNL
jgi:hypothetical protein